MTKMQKYLYVFYVIYTRRKIGVNGRTRRIKETSGNINDETRKTTKRLERERQFE